MRTEQEIRKAFKTCVNYILNNEYALTGQMTKYYQRACAYYWVLGGEGDFPIKIYPERKVDEERLNLILKED